MSLFSEVKKQRQVPSNCLSQLDYGNLPIKFQCLSYKKYFFPGITHLDLGLYSSCIKAVHSTAFLIVVSVLISICFETCFVLHLC